MAAELRASVETGDYDSVDAAVGDALHHWHLGRKVETTDVAELRRIVQEGIAAYIARDNSARAVMFVDALEARCMAVAHAPLSYPARDDPAPGLRMAVHGRYLILFRELPLDGAVRVERVVHGARNLRRLL